MRPPNFETTRRQFLVGASTLAAALAVPRVLFASTGASGSTEARSPQGPRILHLELLTSAPLATMKDFYHRVLGLGVLDESPERLTIGAGETRIAFVKAPVDRDKPFYHFAFNIPENKIRSARDWQRERTALLPIPLRLRDPEYPQDVVNYSHWNAHSVFFFDPAHNVVEYIARHDLDNSAAGSFDSRDILYASEIGLIVDDVPATAAQLKTTLGLEQYRGGDEQFTAIGDERGLLLVMRRGRVLSFESEERKAADVFRTAVRVRGDRRGTVVVPEYPYEVRVEA